MGTSLVKLEPGQDTLLEFADTQLKRVRQLPGHFADLFLLLWRQLELHQAWVFDMPVPPCGCGRRRRRAGKRPAAVGISRC